MTRRTLLVICGVLAGLSIAFLGGAYSESRHMGPIQILRQVRQWPVSGDKPAFDSYERLVGYPGKVEVVCPPQTKNTEVLLVAGQSNAANHGGQRFSSRHGTRVVNYFAGKCYSAASPLLGASGIMGESWTLLGDKLIASGTIDTVVLVPAAIYATPIARWTKGGGLNVMLLAVIDDVSTRYQVTRVLWHQGEADFVAGTAEDDYGRLFRSMVQSMRDHGMDAPIYVSVASAGEFSDGWTPDNPVAKAQTALPDTGSGILPGVDTDRLIGYADRYDGVHFSATGQKKFADAWVDILRPASILERSAGH